MQETKEADYEDRGDPLSEVSGIRRVPPILGDMPKEDENSGADEGDTLLQNLKPAYRYRA